MCSIKRWSWGVCFVRIARIGVQSGVWATSCVSSSLKGFQSISKTFACSFARSRPRNKSISYAAGLYPATSAALCRVGGGFGLPTRCPAVVKHSHNKKAPAATAVAAATATASKSIPLTNHVFNQSVHPVEQVPRVPAAAKVSPIEIEAGNGHGLDTLAFLRRSRKQETKNNRWGQRETVCTDLCNRASSLPSTCCCMWSADPSPPFRYSVQGCFPSLQYCGRLLHDTCTRHAARKDTISIKRG